MSRYWTIEAAALENGQIRLMMPVVEELQKSSLFKSFQLRNFGSLHFSKVFSLPGPVENQAYSGYKAWLACGSAWGGGRDMKCAGPGGPRPRGIIAC